MKDVQDAVSKNRFYAVKLGWDQHYNEINELLLPYSGQQSVSLGEEAFALAVFAWQLANGFSSNEADGIIGPQTWAKLQSLLPIKPGSATPAKNSIPVPTSPRDVEIIDGVRFKRKNYGWAAYGGGDLKTRLGDLQRNGKLTITPAEIDMFGLISIPESGGLVNAINSWDSAYMSMGFIQFTIRYYELQEVINRAPDAFKKHGIELDRARLYFPGEKRSIAIQNAPRIGDLRSLDWAVRFYRAGLEDEAIIAQIQVARGILNNLRKRFDPQNYLSRFENSYPNLWAFIYESNNSRPAILHTALKMAIAKAAPANISDPVQFGKTLISELNTATYNYYNSLDSYKNNDEKSKRIKDELDKVSRIITKTGILK